MINLKATNVNIMLPEALWRIKMEGLVSPSRNGEVRKFPFPVILEYTQPEERVLYEPLRDANPFFHLFESIWMLAGRNDVATPAKFAKQMAEYSDDGYTLHGAYGYRWREHFGYDQLDQIIFEFQRDPFSRRMVLGMWDPYIDLSVARAGGKDVPCNTQAYFNVRPGGALDMTVCNRSNDLVWGCCGANVVHMSMLHEYVARGAGLEMGHYYQFANDLHLYSTHYNLLSLGGSNDVEDPYRNGAVKPYPLYGVPAERSFFDRDCRAWVENPHASTRTRYFEKVVSPMYKAWEAYKAHQVDRAEMLIQECEASDWRRAGLEWLMRRSKPLKVVR